MNAIIFFFFGCYIFLGSFSFAELESAIEPNVGCGKKMMIDQALVKYDTTDENFQLFATNSQCYKCIKSLVADGDGQCSLLFTPHEWTLYIVDSATSATIAQKDYTFGEHGKYTISLTDTNSLHVKEDESPADSMKPLNTLIIIICVVIFVAYIPSIVVIVAGYLYKDTDGGSEADEIGVDTVRASLTSSLRSSLVSAPLLQADEFEKTPLMDDSMASHSKGGGVGDSVAPTKPGRVNSLDTFRGLSLFLMIFVNYGGGGYWFFEHADWNGLTFADLLFPWFMWMMGVSMALSFEALAKRDTSKSELWRKAIKRSLTLFGIGMFLANGYELSTWRIPGVLQYFAVSYIVTCATVFVCDKYTKSALERTKAREKDFYDGMQNWAVHPEDRFLGGLCHPLPSTIMFSYRAEWLIQSVILLIYLLVSLTAQAPGCPRGYEGPGGIGDHGDHPECTGGIHKYLDIQLFTSNLIYHHPTCLKLYNCEPYDPEGFLGALSACTLTYLGLMAGRCIVLFKNHKSRVTRWMLWGVGLLFIAGCLCGFKQNGGLIPVNKNLWSTSFVFVTAGGGLVMLTLTYVLVDVLRVWSGFPFRQMGMNSILIYVGHDILGGFFPFSYQTNSASHARQLQMNTIGVSCWAVIAYYLYHKKIFWKV